MNWNPVKKLASLRHEEIESLFDYLEETQFWIKDEQARYLRVNRAFHLNYSLPHPADAVGLTDFDLSPPYLARQFFEDDVRVLSGQRIIGRIELVGRFDQVTRWFRTTKVPVRDHKGNIAGTAGVTRELPGLQAPGFTVPELAAALDALQHDPSDTWTNADLARLSGLSVSAFERKFRRHLQTSPMQFLKRLRLSRAAAALVQSDRLVSEVAVAEGFCDQAHFTREFKRAFGTTPKVWRDNYLEPSPE